MLQVQSPFQQFFDSSGTPLENGSLYVGSVNQNPETNPIALYWDDAATIPAAQPIKVSGGYPVRNGTPARVYTALEDYSMTVKDKKGRIVFTVLDATSLGNLQVALAAVTGSSLIGYQAAGAGSQSSTVKAQLDQFIFVDSFIPAGTVTSTTNCAPYINAAFTVGAGKTVIFGMGAVYKADDTIIIKGDYTKILGRGATINSYATVRGVNFELVGGTRYPNNIDAQDLSVNGYGVGAYVFEARTSYSTYRRLSIGIPLANVSGRGLVLIGDETNGTGPYYNTFVGCDVQSGSSGLDHIGVSFMTQAPSHNRAPNANTFIGCRAASCLKDWVIKGNGNVLVNPVAESPSGTGIGFVFEADTPTSCQQNFIFGCYGEAPATMFYFNADSKNNAVFGAFGTGSATWKTDLGVGNQVLSAIGSWAMPEGISFPTLSTDPAALDYYAEGTWTPVPTGVTVNSGTPVWVGTYTRIGNRVFANISMTGGNITLGAATSHVTLPFTSADTDWGVFGQKSVTVRLGAVATYGADLYFADGTTQSAISASITFRV
jgi:Head binding